MVQTVKKGNTDIYAMGMYKFHRTYFGKKDIRDVRKKFKELFFYLTGGQGFKNTIAPVNT